MEQLIFQQFTGLHDKNGKEIYEGDIVKFPKQWWHSDRHEADKMFVEEITWGDDYGSWWRFSGGDWSVEKEDVEVIGNIYENPELLN